MAPEPIRKVRLMSGEVRYRVTVDAARRPHARRLQQRTSHRTLREARQHLAAVRSGLRDGSMVSLHRLTVSEYLDTWLHGKRDLRPTTRRGYVDALKPLHSSLGSRQL